MPRVKRNIEPELRALVAQQKTAPEMAAAIGVSLNTVMRGLTEMGINLPRGNPNTNGRRRSNPKRVSWLNELGEAPAMRPDVVVVPGPAIVVDKPRPKRARRADPLATPATPEQLAAARAMLAATKARHDQSIYARAKATVASLIAYKQRWCL